MYATVESCSACSQPCLHLGWDHNEAIFLTDFSTCWSSDAPEPLACLGAASWAVALVVQPGWWRDHQAHISDSPPLRQSHAPSIINAQRGVFFHFNNSSQMTLLKATFKKVFNYLFSDVCLNDAFLFCSAPPGPAWMVFLSKPCVCLGSPTGKFCEIIFIDWLGVV